MANPAAGHWAIQGRQSKAKFFGFFGPAWLENRQDWVAFEGQTGFVRCAAAQKMARTAQ